MIKDNNVKMNSIKTEYKNDNGTHQLNTISTPDGVASMPNPFVSLTKLTQDVDFLCPICNKSYKFKKSLAKHVCSCNDKSNSIGFLSPCGCEGVLLYSIFSIDEHNLNVHKNKLMFNCKMCMEQHKNATGLYGHLLLSHNYEWNPYKDINEVMDTTTVTYDSAWVKNSCVEDDIEVLKVVKDEAFINNNIEDIIDRDINELPNLMFPSNQIHVCEYCSGRYISITALDEHIRSHHFTGLIKEETLVKKIPTIFESPKGMITRHKIDVSDKEQLITAFKTNKDVKQISEELGIKYKTATSIINKWLKYGILSKGKHGGYRKPSISSAIGKQLLDFVELKNLCVLRDMQVYLESSHNVSVSLTTISKYLHGKCVTTKVIRDITGEKNSDTTKLKRVNYVQFLMDNSIQMDQCIHINEMGFDFWLKRSYGGIFRHDRSISPWHGQTGDKTTLRVAISPRGIVHHKVSMGRFDVAGYQEFISELSMLLGSECYYFIMDNRCLHYHLATENDQHKLLFLPPCSTFLSPTQSVFNTLKSDVRGRVNDLIKQINFDATQRRDILWTVIENQILLLSHSNFESNYRRCASFYYKCLEMADILEN